MITQKLNIIFSAILLLLFISSCTIQKEIKIDVLKPAEINIPSQYRNLLIVDNTKLQPENTGNYLVQKNMTPTYKIPSKSELGKLMSGAIELKPTGEATLIKKLERKDSLKLDSVGFSCVFNTANTLLKSEFIDTVIVWENNVSQPSLGWSNQMLRPQSVRALIDASGMDMLVSLDMIKYETSINYSLWYGEIYDVYAETRMFTLWRFYDGKSMQLLKSESIIDTMYFDVYNYNLNLVGYLETMVSESAWAMGEVSAQKMYPYWKTVSRVFFKSGTPGIRLGTKYYENKRYDDAYNAWQKEYESSRGKGKARAAFNMAFIMELSGDLNKALEYISLAKMVYDDSKVLSESNPEYMLIKKYMGVLEKRQEEEGKLFDAL